MPMRRSFLRRAPLLGSPRLQLRLQNRRTRGDRQRESGRQGGEDGQSLKFNSNRFNRENLWWFEQRSLRQKLGVGDID